MAIILGTGGLLASLLSLIFGVLILAFPSLLRWIVGVYLIIIGALGVIGAVL
jgi:hypothetical protein